MRAVVQRVLSSKVVVEDNIVGSIGNGLLVFLGVGREDDEKDVSYLVEKIMGLRIFEDNAGKMNLSLLDIKGEILVASQFTLYGDVRKGKRPNFTSSAPLEIAEDLYEDFVLKCKGYDIKVQNGIFGANMKVSLINDGPVTILLDSKKNF